MRPLTLEEKTQSQSAKKRANKALTADRAKIGYTIRNLKGSPVIVRLDGEEITLDYELLRGMLRRLKGRCIDMRVLNPYLLGGSYALAIYHSAPGSRSKGEIELYQVPDYQRMHLSDLPIIQLD